jgi:hypothetical protein
MLFKRVRYPDVAPDRPRGQWVDTPNGRFDPKIGHKLCKKYIDELTPRLHPCLT